MIDTILVNGMEWGKKKTLAEPIAYNAFLQRLLTGLDKDKEGFRESVSKKRKVCFSPPLFGMRSPDLNDPLEVGWALVLPENSQSKSIAEALKRLVDHRRGRIIYVPTLPDVRGALAWIRDTYSQWSGQTRPYYVLIAGAPQRIPFQFQYLLDVSAAVGRLSFERIEDYAAYADKLVDFETDTNAQVERRAIFFAPENPGDKALHLSRTYMADPLVNMLREEEIEVSYLVKDDATLANLETALRGKPASLAPALVYTASHGLGVTGRDEDLRKQMQGALCCQDYDGSSGVFSADRVPAGQFLHGTIMVSFACYGAGTPRDSDFYHWIGDPGLLNCSPQQDFVAALPQRLLAHPKGPVAFFGHIDPAWVHSFADPDRISGYAGWGSRMRAFKEVVDLLLKGFAVGYACKEFNEVYATCSSELAIYENQFQKDRTKGQNPQWTSELVDLWITRNDTQNFIVLGDPAAKAKTIP